MTSSWFPSLLLVLHAAAAALAAFRLTELLLIDKLADRIRRRFGKYYVFSCARCMSVWCGAAVTAAFALLPWLNWPLALSWLFITAMDRRAQRNKPMVSVSPQPARPGGQRMTSDAPKPLDPALAAKLAAFQAQQRGPQPSQAAQGARTPDAIIRDQLGALMMQILQLQAENEQLRAQLSAHMAQPVVTGSSAR